MATLRSTLALVRGGGDMGTGTAHRLHRCGCRVVVTELPMPLVIRRAVAFASAVYDGCIEVEGVQARLGQHGLDAQGLLELGSVPVVVDASGSLIAELHPDVVVDARMAKRNLGTTCSDAAIVIGLGPGFTAGRDVHAVVETQGGHHLGRVLLQGCAEPDTHVPREVQGFKRERVLWAPCGGSFRGCRRIGDRVEVGEVVAEVAGSPVRAAIGGVLRGLLHDGLLVRQGQKIGDIDPRGIAEYCFTISDKARAVAGGVLEAILYWQHQAQR